MSSSSAQVPGSPMRLDCDKTWSIACRNPRRQLRHERLSNEAVGDDYIFEHPQTRISQFLPPAFRHSRIDLCSALSCEPAVPHVTVFPSAAMAPHSFSYQIHNLQAEPVWCTYPWQISEHRGCYSSHTTTRIAYLARYKRSRPTTCGRSIVPGISRAVPGRNQPCCRNQNRWGLDTRINSRSRRRRLCGKA